MRALRAAGLHPTRQQPFGISARARHAAALTRRLAVGGAPRRRLRQLARGLPWLWGAQLSELLGDVGDVGDAELGSEVRGHTLLVRRDRDPDGDRDRDGDPDPDPDLVVAQGTGAGGGGAESEGGVEGGVEGGGKGGGGPDPFEEAFRVLGALVASAAAEGVTAGGDTEGGGTTGLGPALGGDEAEAAEAEVGQAKAALAKAARTRQQYEALPFPPRRASDEAVRLLRSSMASLEEVPSHCLLRNYLPLQALLYMVTGVATPVQRRSL